MNQIKFYLVLFLGWILLLCQNVTAQTGNVSQVPFVYLNQYFNFEIFNSHEIKISETKINFDDFKIATRGNQIVLDIKDVKNLNLDKGYFLIKPKNPQLKDAQLTFVKEKLQYTFTSPFEVGLICLTQISIFTKIEICKNPVVQSPEFSNGFKPIVKIDGVLFDGAGTVVLKDNLENVTLEAQISEFNTLRLSTKKRKIFPRRIQKKSDQNFIQVQFVDVNLVKGNAWTATLSLDQSFFEIQLDPLIKLSQDIFYKSDNVKNDAINYVYVETKKAIEAPIYYNDYTAEFYGVYLSLGGQSSALKAGLVSDLGKGLRVSSKRRINTKMDAHYAASYAQLGFVSDSPNLIYNANQSVFAVSGGVSYHLKSRFDIASKFEIRKDLFFRRHDLTTNSLDVISGLNKEISVAPNWTFLDSVHSRANFQFGFSYLLPTTADTETVGPGLGYKLALNYIYKMSFGNVKFETFYFKRQQNSDNFIFNEQTAFYSLGYQYLF